MSDEREQAFVERERICGEQKALVFDLGRVAVERDDDGLASLVHRSQHRRGHTAGMLEL